MEKYNSFARLAGDIILINPPNKMSLNTIGQTISRGKKASFSHVAITMDHGSIIHSTTPGGVNLDSIKVILNEVEERPIKVIRRVEFDNNRSLAHDFINKIMFYHKQKYNYYLSLRIQETRSYCSELAAKVYQNIGLPISQKKPRKTLPIDIEIASTKEGWIDVTPLYLESPFSQLVEDQLMTISEEWRKGLVNMQHIQNSQAEFQTQINKQNSLTGQDQIDIKFPHKYFNSPSK